MQLTSATIAILLTAAYAAQYCRVTPEIVKVSDTTVDGTTASIVLNSQPTGPVSVYFESTNLARIDKCMLIFTPENWQTAQDIVVNSGQMLLNDNRAEVNVGMRFHSTDVAFNERTDSFKVIREISGQKTCVSNGDPHLSTFDGKGYDAHLPGYHYLVKSNKLVIQTEHYQCNDNANMMCNGNVAFAYMGGGVSFTINHEKDDSGQNHRKLVTKFGDQSEISVTENGDRTIFKLSDGSTIEILTIKSLRWFNDITVTLPGHYMNKVTGLCGDFDGKIENDDFAGAAGSVHRVDNSDVLVTCGANCLPKTTGGVVLGEICVIPSVFPPLQTLNTAVPVGVNETPSSVPITDGGNQTPAVTSSAATTAGVDTPVATLTSAETGYETPVINAVPATQSGLIATSTTAYAPSPVATTSTTEDNGYGLPPVFEFTPPPAAPNVDLPPLPDNLDSPSYAQAKQICSEVFANLVCGAVSVEFYTRGCIIDSVLAGSPADVANNALKQFMAQCNTHFNQLTQSPHKGLVNQALTLQSDYGFTLPNFVRPAVNGGGKVVRPAAPPKSNLQCKNGGTLTGYGGCLCVGAWEGVDCSISTANLRTFTPTTEDINAVSEVQAAPASASSDASSMIVRTVVGIIAAGFVALFV